MRTITSYRIRVTWHETAGAYDASPVDASRSGQAAQRTICDAMRDHDKWGRMYEVYATFSDGSSRRLSLNEEHALRNM